MYLSETLKKNVVLCGLDLDYKRTRFGTMMELLSKATNVFKMAGKCAKCNDVSCYSHRISNSYFQILIGTTQYIPLCETCYIRENNL